MGLPTHARSAPPGRRSGTAAGRYHARVTGPAAPTRSGIHRARALVPAILAAAVGASVLFFLAGPLGVTSGLLIVSTALGWIVGLAVRPAGDDSSAGRRVAAAVGLALAACALAWVATWGWSRVEGGALGPFDFLAEVYGVLLPAQIVFAALGAALGAR